MGSPQETILAAVQDRVVNILHYAMERSQKWITAN